VVSSRSALPEIVGSAGLATADTDGACADAVEQILGRDAAERRRRARRHAERFDWPTSVNGFLAAHDLSVSGAPAATPVPIMQPVGQP
jgi:alpha-1,6-mannosyltransferase